jgi:glycosyltransferase involved in cell wall biosynthesis
MRSSSACKVLYVSDSLGTPIHPRGIFNYSVSAVEILKSLGMEVTLVVEGSSGYGGYGIDGSTAEELARTAPAASETLRLAEVYRYFSGSRFSYRFEYQAHVLRALAKRAPNIIKGAHRAISRVRPARTALLRNDTSMLQWVPSEGAHLQLADRLLVADGFYSQSMLRGANGTGPVAIDGSGYDIVFIDTPHYVDVLGVGRDQVIAVVHDLIPLQDVQMPGDWRGLFRNKLDSTLKNSGTLIFVSEATRDTFNALFPEHKGFPSTILYPAIRSGLLAASEQPTGPASGYPQIIGDQVRATRLERRAKQVPASALLALALGQTSERNLRAFLAAGTEWDPKLPFFTTIVSDEPRKNIGILVEAAEALRGEANIVVLGQVDGVRHTGGQPERYPNVHFTGYVSEAEKLDIVRRSAGLVFPSFSEGFGIPVVEGAIFGRPVICSDIPVFREITGGLARYINPTRTDDLVRAVRDILRGPAEAARHAAPLRELCVNRYRQSAMAKRLTETLEGMRRRRKSVQAA